jgi:putative ABC transport system permease protein
MPISTLQNDFFGPDIINGVYLNAKPQIRDTLIKAENVSSILSIQDMKDSYMDFLKVTYISIYLIVVVGILLGVAIVYNSIILMMNERTIEIASMRVLGVTIPEIFSIFTREICVIGFFGILLGLPMSHYTLQFISNLFSTELYSVSADIKATYYLSAAGITLLTIMLSLGMTYRKIKHADFVDALKNQVT